jgi:hypothetical protein
MRPYCDGTIYDAQWQAGIDAGSTREQVLANYFLQQPDARIPDLHGTDTRTTPAMLAFRSWLLEQSAATRDRTIVNATGGGTLYGPGVQQSTLNDALGTAPPLGELVRERLVAAHRASAASPVSLRPDVDRLLQASQRKAPPLFKGWREFSLNTVSDDQIATALKRSRAPRRYHSGPGGAVATLVSVHVPSSGGGSLLSALRRYYGEDAVLVDHHVIDLSWTPGNTAPSLTRHATSAPDLRDKAILHGHFHGGAYREIDAPRVTQLRPPVDRLLAHYYFALTRPSGPIGGFITRHKLSALDFAMIPVIRRFYSEVFFNGVDMRSFDVIVGPDTYDADIARIGALLGTPLDVTAQYQPAKDPGQMREAEVTLRRQLAEILEDDIRFYQDVMAARR